MPSADSSSRIALLLRHSGSACYMLLQRGRRRAPNERLAVRRYCETILDSTQAGASELGDRQIERAEQYLELTSKRVWTVWDKGRKKIVEAAYDYETIHSNRPYVYFRSRLYCPVDTLDPADQDVLERLLTVIASIPWTTIASRAGRPMANWN